MINVKNIRTPTRFEATTDISSDSRFQKVKIYIAHDGENLNNSVFPVETLKQMGETLPYCPILGYVKTNNGEEDDFGGHEVSYKITDAGIEEECGTRAYGFIGEDNEAHIETVGGKNWLVCYGYLWTRFTKSIDIFNDSNGSKGQSMEVADAEGSVDDQGRVVYTKAILQGLCILGDDVTPAMTGSTISTVFSAIETKSLIKEMVEEFAKEKGANEVDKDKDKKDPKIVDPEENKDAESDTKPVKGKKEKESAKKGDTKDKSKDKEEDKNSEPESNDEDKEPKTKSKDKDKDDKTFELDHKKTNFELSYEDTEQKLRDAINDPDSNYWNCVIDTFPDHFIFKVYSEDEDVDGKYFDVKYTVENDEVSLGEKTEVIPMYVTPSEKQSVEDNRQKVKDLQSQLKTLMSYKENVEHAEKEEELKAFESRLNSEQIKEITEKFSKLGIEDIKKEIAYQVVKNEQDIRQQGATVFSHNIKANEKADRYGAYVDQFFKK